MRAVEFVNSLAVFVCPQVARVALRTARGVEPVFVALEDHEVEQAQQDAGASDNTGIVEKERDETADQDGDQHDEADALNRFVGELAYAPHRTRNEDARHGRQDTDREKQDIGFHGCTCTPVPQRLGLSSDSEGEIKNVGQNSDLLSEALE